MSNDTTPRCACGSMIEPGDAFCGECGRPVPGPASSPAAARNPDGMGGAMEDASPVFHLPKPPPRPEPPPCPDPEPAGPLAAIDFIAGNTDQEKMENNVDDFRIEIDMGKSLFENINATFSLRILSSSGFGTVRGLHVAVETDGHRSVESRPVTMLGAGPSQVRLNYKVSEHGPRIFFWTVSWTKDGRKLQATAETEHLVLPDSTQSRQEATGNLSININATGHANDWKFDRLLKDFYNGQGGVSLEKVLEENQARPPRWVTMPLHLVDDDAADPLALLPQAPATARAGGLTLECRGARIHLISGTTLQLGRNREGNAIVTRNFDRKGIATSILNGRISRWHARILLENEACFVEDRGADPGTGLAKASACGTWLGKDRIPAGGRRELPPGQPIEVLLGAASADDGAFRLRATFFRCTDRRRHDCPQGNACWRTEACSLLLERFDQTPERWIAVWRRADLGILDPGLASLQVWQRDGAFAITGAGKPAWLVPGTSLKLPAGQEIKVGPLAQCGL